MKIIKLSEEKLKRKRMQRSSAELHKVLPVLKLFKDKKTIKRIVDLHQVQGLSFPILGERFGVSTSRITQIIRYQREKQQKVVRPIPHSLLKSKL